MHRPEVVGRRASSLISSPPPPSPPPLPHALKKGGGQPPSNLCPPPPPVVRAVFQVRRASTFPGLHKAQAPAAAPPRPGRPAVDVREEGPG